MTKRYQVTIPKEVREAVGIKAGGEVVFMRTKPLDDFLREMAEITKT
ncbi:AbrB/MazE/SpoVT family DNA-binding domain-containing protein [Thermococcus sp.]